MIICFRDPESVVGHEVQHTAVENQQCASMLQECPWV